MWTGRSSGILTLTLLLSFPLSARAGEASRFTVKADGAREILLRKDHYSVSLVKGWVSSSDNFFKALLSKKDKLIVSVKSESTFFDGNKNTFALLLENTDIKKNTDRPWGLTKVILDRVPADSASSVDLRLAINRSDTLTKLFAAVKSVEPTAVGVDLQPWLGYANVITAITTQFFGTEKTNYPFTWSGDVKTGDVAGPDRMLEHYVVLIAPNKDGDSFVVNLDASKLSYDENSQQVKYGGKLITDHSYAVLKVTKAAPYDITQLLFESQAAWAVLAVSQFLTIPVSDVKNVDQLSGISTNLVVQLRNELELLKREHRFSAYDRAVALYTFADSSEGTIHDACGKLGIADNGCPLGELTQFKNNIKKAFGLPDELFKSVPQDATKVRSQVMLKLR